MLVHLSDDTGNLNRHFVRGNADQARIVFWPYAAYYIVGLIAELGDAAHSGGQQVIAGLVLLMAMAETEGDSFFIVDVPFAHLSLDRIDDVGKFLRKCGAQFLLTVPTTLDRGQLDPASLLIVLRKKAAHHSHAPGPIVARA